MSHHHNGGGNGPRDEGWGNRGRDDHRHQQRHDHYNDRRYCYDDRSNRKNQDVSHRYYDDRGHQQHNHTRNNGGNNYSHQNQNSNRKRDAPYSSDYRAATKRPSNTSYRNHDNGLTSQEHQIKMQIQDSGVCVNYMSRQAFQRPEGWDEKLQKAVESTIVKVLAEIKKKNEGNGTGSVDSYSDSDEDGPNYTPVGVSERAPDENIAHRDIINFIRQLASCHQMMAGFHVDKLFEKDLDKICVCPCSKYGLGIDDLPKCDSISFKPSGLMNHLKKKGGLYSAKENRKLKEFSLECKYHYAANVFLREVYADYHGDVGHEALYDAGTEMYLKAIAASNRESEKEKQAVVRENKELKSKVEASHKKVMDLEKVNEMLFNKQKRLEDEMAKLGVVKKEKHAITNDELQQYRDNIKLQCEQMQFLVGPPDQGFEKVKVCVKPDQDGRASFSLQSFLDSLYDGNMAASAFTTKKDFNRCYEVFFGDIDSVSKAKAVKIAKGLIYDFNVEYSNNEVYKITKKANDAGGPSRQFINDAFLQMKTLSIPVKVRGKSVRSVRLFCQETAGKIRESVIELLPRLDDDLEREVRGIAKMDDSTDQGSPEVDAIVEKSIDRIKLYSRVMVMLRGVMPGNSLYDRSDILRDIDGVLCRGDSNATISYWLEDGELDDMGNPWTVETIFSKRISIEFIDTRSIILGGLIDGLSICGKKCRILEELHQGSDLRCHLSCVPIEAISKILFARPNLSYEDVYEALCAGELYWFHKTRYMKVIVNPFNHVLLAYNQPENWKDEQKQTQENMDYYRQEQERFYETVFLPYIQEEAKKDPSFLSKFVECCTGSSCLPYTVGGDSPVQITVEFNLGLDALEWPNFHTCEMEMVLSGHVTHDADSFREMMNNAIELCRTRFEME
eukprot:scaffold4989_cov64-Cyclotella_meneghiniana.AAC.1